MTNGIERGHGLGHDRQGNLQGNSPGNAHGEAQANARAGELRPAGAQHGPGSEFHRLLGRTAGKLGVDRPALDAAMGEARALFAERADLDEEARLAGMLDHVLEALNLSDLSDEDMLRLAQLSRTSFGDWEREAAREEGVLVSRPGGAPIEMGLRSGLEGLPGMPPLPMSGRPPIDRPALDRNVASMIARELREARRIARDEEA